MGLTRHTAIRRGYLVDGRGVITKGKGKRRATIDSVTSCFSGAIAYSNDQRKKKKRAERLRREGGREGRMRETRELREDE